jgi:hypothetical protein
MILSTNNMYGYDTGEEGCDSFMSHRLFTPYFIPIYGEGNLTGNLTCPYLWRLAGSGVNPDSSPLFSLDETY